jgi:DNA-binding transcriptional LysR family regulator
MDTNTLAIFAEVARRGGFSAVARERGIDASSVSRAIASLESELGARLFQRTTRHLMLTEAGRIYLKRIAPVLTELESAREEIATVRSGPVGDLRLTASIAFGQVMLVPLLRDFTYRFPKLKLDLLLTDANVDLVAEGVDIAVRLAPSYRADVVGVRLFSTHYRVVASPAWIAANGMPGSPEALANTPCILLSLPEFRTRWLFRRNGKTVDVAVHGNLIISSVQALRQAAINGLGPALLADWMIGSDLAEQALVDVFPTHAVTATTFDTAAWLLYPTSKQLPFKVRAVMDFLRAHIRRSAKK